LGIACWATALVAAQQDAVLLPAFHPASTVEIRPVEYDQPTSNDSSGSSFQRGWNNFTNAITPKPQQEPAPDPTSLKTPGHAGPEVPLAMARFYEQQGNLAEAAKLYQQAIKGAPTDPHPLAAYGHLKARNGELAEATELYQKALRLAPDDPSILNDLGLCFARRKMFADASKALNRAVQLQPANVLYHNNLATLLVDTGQVDNAFTQLSLVHPPAVAHYNLGYLLYKKGQAALAAQHFSFALQIDPSFAAAQFWLVRLGAAAPPVATAPPAGPQPGPPNDFRVADRPQPSDSAPSFDPPSPNPAPSPPPAASEPAPTVGPVISNPGAYVPSVTWCDSPRVANRPQYGPQEVRVTPPAQFEHLPEVLNRNQDPLPRVAGDLPRGPAVAPPLQADRPRLQLLPPVSSSTDPAAPLPPPVPAGFQRLPQP
jgi:Tfp pilus assembly protein PilF